MQRKARQRPKRVQSAVQRQLPYQLAAESWIGSRDPRANLSIYTRASAFTTLSSYLEGNLSRVKAALFETGKEASSRSQWKGMAGATSRVEAEGVRQSLVGSQVKTFRNFRVCRLRSIAIRLRSDRSRVRKSLGREIERVFRPRALDRSATCESLDATRGESRLVRSTRNANSVRNIV